MNKILTAFFLVGFGLLGFTLAQPVESKEVLIMQSNLSPLEVKINDERTSRGLPTLTNNDRLDSSACMKAKDMLDNDYWSHTSPTGITAWYWLDKADYTYQTAGENLAENYDNDRDAVIAWMNSPEHRDNILGDYTEQGSCEVTGTLKGKTTTLIVSHFGKV